MARCSIFFLNLSPISVHAVSLGWGEWNVPSIIKAKQRKSKHNSSPNTGAKLLYNLTGIFNIADRVGLGCCRNKGQSLMSLLPHIPSTWAWDDSPAQHNWFGNIAEFKTMKAQQCFQNKPLSFRRKTLTFFFLSLVFIFRLLFLCCLLMGQCLIFFFFVLFIIIFFTIEGTDEHSMWTEIKTLRPYTFDLHINKYNGDWIAT